MDVIYNLDSKAWRSFFPLLTKPGHLTNEYIAGRRVNYLPPFRMYLLFSILFFLVAAIPDNITTENLGENIGQNTGQIIQDVNEQIEEADQNVQATKDQIFQDLQDAGLVEEEDINEAGITLNIPADTVELDFTPNLAFLSEQDDSVAAEIGGCDDIPWADFLGTRLGTRAYNACLPTSSDNGATLMQSFLNNLPIVMFLCVPLLAVSMKFLYVFKRRKYVEHLMFLFHTHSFIFALVILNIIFVRLSNNYAGVHNLLPWLVTGIWIYAVIYVFLALRRVYKQGRFMTSFKMLLLVPCYPICIAMAFVLVLLFTLITF